MNRRQILASIALALATGPARAQWMSEAERRAQRTALAERQLRKTSEQERAPKTAEGDTRILRPISEVRSGEILIETGSRMLHYRDITGALYSWPIAVGREGAQWKGTTVVTGKRRNPEWRPTPNMRRRDPSLPVVVRPGPKNPLGTHAIYLAEGYLRIHGTNAPSSIGKAASSGCFRMYNEDVSVLFEMVGAGTTVRVVD